MGLAMFSLITGMSVIVPELTMYYSRTMFHAFIENFYTLLIASQLCGNGITWADIDVLYCQHVCSSYHMASLWHDQHAENKLIK